MSLCTLPGVGGLCHTITAPVAAATGTLTTGVLTATRDAVISACVWVVTQVITATADTTHANLTSTAMSTHYALMARIGMLATLPLLFLAVLTGALRGDLTAVLRSIAGALPAAALLTLIAVQITQTLVDVIDGLSTNLITLGPNPGTAIGHAIPAVLGGTPIPLVIGILVGMAAICAALCIWCELIVRSAAIEIAVMFLPLAFAGIIWPTTARYARRLAEILGSLVFSKLVVIGVVSLGISELVSGNISGVLAGTAMLGLAAFAPFVLLSLIPIAIDAGHLGNHRRQSMSVTQVHQQATQHTQLLMHMPATRHTLHIRPTTGARA